MKKLIGILGSVLLGFAANYSHAEDIGTFIGKNNATASFNCAYKQVKASKKCLVSINTVKASTPRTIQFFGKNGRHPLLKIKWPDGDVSQYALLDSLELWNLADTNGYNFKTRQDTESEFELDLRRGLIIEKDYKEHVRLW